MFDFGKGIAAAGRLARVQGERMGAISINFQRSAKARAVGNNLLLDGG